MKMGFNIHVRFKQAIEISKREGADPKNEPNTLPRIKKLACKNTITGFAGHHSPLEGE
jgi:hypothetical protein